jgi:hypothetical protein
MSRRSLFSFALGVGAAAGIAVAFSPALQARGQSDRYDRIRCESRNGGEQFCAARIDGDVRVVRELSNDPCREGRTWKWDRNGITVREGCRADFEYRRTGGGWTGSGSGSGWGNSGGGWGGWDRGGSGYNRDRVTCQSTNNREAACPAPIAGDIRVARMLNDKPCVEGRDWSWSRDGVRVWNGCRAEFEYRRHNGDYNMDRGFQRVTCQGQRDREQFCPAPIDSNVRLLRELGGTRCIEGRNWNWSKEGVRVWEGCRAEFEFQPRQ